MQPQRALEGTVVENPNGAASETQRMRDTLSHLTRELNDALRENEELRKRVATADAPIARLREKLTPFYQLLQAIFGDIDEIDPDDVAERRGPANARSSAVWERWKEQLGGAPAKIIQALLDHGSADHRQLAILIETKRMATIYTAISRLNKAGLLNKNGDKFSLKQL